MNISLSELKMLFLVEQDRLKKLPADDQQAHTQLNELMNFASLIEGFTDYPMCEEIKEQKS